MWSLQRKNATYHLTAWFFTSEILSSTRNSTWSRTLFSTDSSPWKTEGSCLISVARSLRPMYLSHCQLYRIHANIDESIPVVLVTGLHLYISASASSLFLNYSIINEPSQPGLSSNNFLSWLRTVAFYERVKRKREWLPSSACYCGTRYVTWNSNILKFLFCNKQASVPFFNQNHLPSWGWDGSWGTPMLEFRTTSPNSNDNSRIDPNRSSTHNLRETSQYALPVSYQTITLVICLR